MLPTFSQLKNYHDTPTENAYNAFVGWAETSDHDPFVCALYSSSNIKSLSDAITNALQGVHPENKKIIVPDETIAQMLSNVYRNGTRPNIGDIHTRYIIPQNEPRCDLRSINNQTINIIVRSIKDEFQTIEQNKRLSVWNSVYGDFNKEGLRAHAPIKIRRRHPQYMAFNMNY